MLPTYAKEVVEKGTATERAAAKILLENFSGLVEVVILSPEGKLVEHRDFNDILARFPDLVGNWQGDLKATQFFLSFLGDAAKKALQMDPIVGQSSKSQ